MNLWWVRRVLRRLKETLDDIDRRSAKLAALKEGERQALLLRSEREAKRNQAQEALNDALAPKQEAERSAYLALGSILGAFALAAGYAANRMGFPALAFHTLVWLTAAKEGAFGAVTHVAAYLRFNNRDSATGAVRRISSIAKWVALFPLVSVAVLLLARLLPDTAANFIETAVPYAVFCLAESLAILTGLTTAAFSILSRRKRLESAIEENTTSIAEINRFLDWLHDQERLYSTQSPTDGMKVSNAAPTTTVTAPKDGQAPAVHPTTMPALATQYAAPVLGTRTDGKADGSPGLMIGLIAATLLFGGGQVARAATPADTAGSAKPVASASAATAKTKNVPPARTGLTSAQSTQSKRGPGGHDGNPVESPNGVLVGRVCSISSDATASVNPGLRQSAVELIAKSAYRFAVKEGCDVLRAGRFSDEGRFAPHVSLVVPKFIEPKCDWTPAPAGVLAQFRGPRKKWEDDNKGRCTQMRAAAAADFSRKIVDFQEQVRDAIRVDQPYGRCTNAAGLIERFAESGTTALLATDADDTCGHRPTVKPNTEFHLIVVVIPSVGEPSAQNDAAWMRAKKWAGFDPKFQEITPDDIPFLWPAEEMRASK